MLNRWMFAALAARLLPRSDSGKRAAHLRDAWLSRIRGCRGTMIKHPTRASARNTLEAMCLAIQPTSTQIQAACEAFAKLIAFCCNDRVEIRIGGVLIAREPKA